MQKNFKNYSNKKQKKFYIFYFYVIMFNDYKIKGDKMSEERYLLWLSLVPALSSIKKIQLVQIFKTCKNLFYSSEKELLSLELLTKKEVSSLVKNKSFDLEKYLQYLDENNIKYYSFFSEFYPKKLRTIDTPPFLIYVKGEEVYNNAPTVAVIGSRRCTEYGKQVAYELSRDLGKYGVVVISGMAYGIDTFAHKGIVKNNGKTIGVLGCSLDICYPNENRDLKLEIENNGCTISEYQSTTKAISYNFPVRNRIMAGLSDGIIVVESGERSGTNITVNNALDYGKEVFAVPGSIYSKSSKGTNELIKEGAIPITSADDIVSHLNIKLEKVVQKEETKLKKNISLTEKEELILSFISRNPIEVENIMNKSNLKINEVQVQLTMLELKGIITKLPGQRYIMSV